ncbi:hypothetical protein GYMLUDRAFT_952929 [Collybiopsis luxurians FD-317 M1]|nr:hypothetical protein GYMLUDRAFT_952929 [Collybiopsis luxurians FD-317 M1]
MESLDDWSESLAIQLLDDDRDSGMQDKSWGGRGPITTARKFSSSSEGQELAGTSNERPTISAPTFRSASEENENLYRQYLARMDLKRSASSTYGLLSASAVSQDSEKQNWGSAEGEKSANYRRILPNGRTWQSAAMPRSENDRERLIESAEEPSPVVKSLPFPGIVELSVDEVYGSVSTRVSSEGGLQWDNPVLRDALDGYRRRQAILSI